MKSSSFCCFRSYGITYLPHYYFLGWNFEGDCHAKRIFKELNIGDEQGSDVILSIAAELFSLSGSYYELRDLLLYRIAGNAEGKKKKEKQGKKERVLDSDEKEPVAHRRDRHRYPSPVLVFCTRRFQTSGTIVLYGNSRCCLWVCVLFVCDA